MDASQRRTRVAELVKERKYLTIDSLSNEFAVSTSTVRRDLKIMEKEGGIQLLYGGIVMRKSPLEPYADRECRNVLEKRALAKVAAQMVNEGDVIIIDAGSTASQVAQAIATRKDLVEATIITPAINVARMFLHKPGVKVLLSGGEFVAESEGMLGRVAEDFFSKVHAHAVFLSCVGIVPESGAMYADHGRAALRRAMVDCASKVVLLADYSKFGKIAAASGFTTKEISTLITDERTPEIYLQAFRSAGVDVKQIPVERSH